MPFLNALNSSPDRLNTASDQNCAGCSAAGAVSLIRYSHSTITSRAATQYCEIFCTPGFGFLLGASVNEQCKNIVRFVQSKTNRQCIQSENGMNLVVATRLMKSYPVGTVFVIYVEGPLIGNSFEYTHFLNAVNSYGSIYYIDFQTNRDARINNRGRKFSSFIGNEGPSTSDSPFIGVRTQALAATRSELHTSTQPGTFIASLVKLKVMAFPPS